MKWSEIRYRIGKLSIPKELLEANVTEVLTLLAQVVVVRAEYHYLNNTVEYQGFSPLFDETAELDPPAYKLSIHYDSHRHIDSIEVQRA